MRSSKRLLKSQPSKGEGWLTLKRNQKTSNIVLVPKKKKKEKYRNLEGELGSSLFPAPFSFCIMKADDSSPKRLRILLGKLRIKIIEEIATNHPDESLAGQDQSTGNISS